MHAEHRVTIARTPHDVFAFVSAGENASRWRSGVMDIRKVSGDGVGAVYAQGVAGPGGRRIAADYRVTQIEPDRLLAFETVAGPVRPSGRFVVEEAPAATKLTFSLDTELAGMKRLVMGKMVAKTMDTEVRNIENIKRLLEAG
jgi:carbon monoxide dehydrogenase subunit G